MQNDRYTSYYLSQVVAEHSVLGVFTTPLYKNWILH